MGVCAPIGLDINIYLFTYNTKWQYFNNESGVSSQFIIGGSQLCKDVDKVFIIWPLSLGSHLLCFVVFFPMSVLIILSQISVDIAVGLVISNMVSALSKWPFIKADSTHLQKRYVLCGGLGAQIKNKLKKGHVSTVIATKIDEEGV